MKQVSFGKYTLLHRIARGGMAELFLARTADTSGIGRICVIKLVSSHYAKDPSFTAMFEDEVRIAASLTHPNIGQVLDVGHVSGHYYLAMEYIHGKDLRAIIRRCLNRAGGPVPPTVAIQIAVKICSALHYAHNARALDGTSLNTVHRDVSPSNIMVSYDGQVKLIDFGIAKAQGRSSLTLPGTIKGKIRYLSPEQIKGKDLDGRSDLFTLGTSLWEATVGRHLFSGKVPSQIYEAVVKGPVKPPSKFVPGYPEGLERVIERALARNRDERYPDARAMQHALEQHAASTGVTISDLALAEFMARMFDEETAAWREAQQRGQSLVDHLLSRVIQPEHETDLDDVLALEDEQTTIPEPAPPATGTREETGAAGQAEDGDAPRRTRPMSSGPGAPEPADPGQRKTMLYSENAAGEDGAPPAPPAADDGGQPAAAAPLRRAVITSEGRATMVGRESSEEEGCRPTMAQDLAQPGDARPTVVEDWSNQFPSPAAAEADPADATGGASPTPTQKKPLATLEPIVAADRVELARKQQEQTQPDPPEGDGRKRTRTGDWAMQATSKGEGRSGTHPLFREAREGLSPAGTSTLTVPVTRRAVVVFVAIALGTATLAMGVWWLTRRPGDTVGAVHRVPDGAAPDVAVRTVQLNSVPPGATVFNAADGQELGRTPLQLAIGEGGRRRVQLRLEGHRLRTVEVGPDPTPPVELEPLAPPPKQPPDAVAPRSKRTPRRRKRDVPSPRGGSHLKNPFGD